jgi:hypothetical protein
MKLLVWLSFNEEATTGCYRCYCAAEWNEALEMNIERSQCVSGSMK